MFVGGLLAGLAGATITLAISPGWFGDLTVNGRGWIAIGLVIFAQWSPLRAAFGALLFGAIFRFILDIQGVDASSASRTRSWTAAPSTFFLEMLPYLMVILVVVIGSREAVRKRIGAPAALGRPVRPRRARSERAPRQPRSTRPRWTSRPSSSIWTKSLVSNASWRGANGESSASPGPIGANSTTTRSSPWTRV